MELKCPECGAEVLSRYQDSEHGLLVIIFKCLFSATFEDNLTNEEMQRRLDEFKSSGRMLEWLKKPIL
jgi:hypothetical protein